MNANAIEIVARWIEEGGPGVNLESTRKLMAGTVRSLATHAGAAAAEPVASVQQDYPSLPEGWTTTMTPDPEGTPHTWFDEVQMRAYVDDDRKTRQLSACNFCLGQAMEARTALAFIDLAGHKFGLRDLLCRAMRNLHKPRRKQPRWAIARNTFGVGSTVANALCRAFDMDPEELLEEGL